MESRLLGMEKIFRRFDAQKVLFSEAPSRRDLLITDLTDEHRQSLAVNVWRNHAFESVGAIVSPYFALRNAAIEFNLGGYDESFGFANRNPASLDLLWMDSRRLIENLGFHGWLSWLQGRLNELRTVTNVPIVVATWFDNCTHAREMQSLADSIPGVYFADLLSICNLYGIKLADERVATLAGTSLGNRAQILIARELACHWLPPLILPPVKALALDLDNTLHLGVLGEDGLDGVNLTEGHVKLQVFCKELKSRGIFLALMSRNEFTDVQKLFSVREDYPLRLDDFSAIEVSWGDKASALSRVAQALRISPSAVLFVDDNVGELGNVVHQHPDVLAVHASDDGDATRRALEFFPGLWRWRFGEDDAKRVADLKANAARDLIGQVSKDSDEYFRSLQVKLAYRINPRLQVKRLADLSGKTNQFNLSLRRLNEADFVGYLSDADSDVVSVELSDRLSDSGVIAVIVAKREDVRLNVVEICISCRAMGRQLEDSIICLALKGMRNFQLSKEVAFDVRDGPRNQPARGWLAALLGLDRQPDIGTHVFPIGLINSFEHPKGVNVIWDLEENND